MCWQLVPCDGLRYTQKSFEESLGLLDYFDPRLDHQFELAQLREFAHHHEVDLGHHLVLHHHHWVVLVQH